LAHLTREFSHFPFTFGSGSVNVTAFWPTSGLVAMKLHEQVHCNYGKEKE
jgi:hypothetical protein